MIIIEHYLPSGKVSVSVWPFKLASFPGHSQISSCSCWKKNEFSPQLRDKIWWAGNETMFDCGRASVRLHYVSWLVVWYSWPLIYLAPLTCTGWPDSIVYCKLQRSWPDCGASPQERSWSEPSDQGEASHVSVCSSPWGVTSLMSKTHGSVACMTWIKSSSCAWQAD